MATTDPNATSMMMTAARMPIASLDPGVAETAEEMGFPPSATRKPGRAKLFATRIRSLVCEVFRSGVVLSNWTTAKAVCPSAEIWRSAPRDRGLRTLVTSGSGVKAPTRRLMVAALAGPSTGPEVCTTTSAVSPAWAGKRWARRFWARWDGELPELKLLLKALPTAPDSAITTNTTRIHPMSTRRRRS